MFPSSVVFIEFFTAVSVGFAMSTFDVEDEEEVDELSVFWLFMFVRTLFMSETSVLASVVIADVSCVMESLSGCSRVRSVRSGTTPGIAPGDVFEADVTA